MTDFAIIVTYSPTLDEWQVSAVLDEFPGAAVVTQHPRRSRSPEFTEVSVPYSAINPADAARDAYLHAFRLLDAAGSIGSTVRVEELTD